MRVVLYSIFAALIAVGIFSGAAQEPIALIAIAIGLGILAIARTQMRLLQGVPPTETS